MTEVSSVERLAAAAAQVREAVAAAARGLVEREVLVELTALAAVAREHLLVLGPPGTAKSEAVRRISHALGGRYFEYLLGRFTEPADIFGPVDLRKLRQGQLVTETTGMLPEAELAFLDEVFRGSTAILNTLLGLLHERTFVKGHTRMTCPLRVCVGAANDLPEDPSLAAFADRFLITVFVSPVQDELLEDLLRQGASLGKPPAAVASLESLDLLTYAAQATDLEPVRPALALAVRQLRGAGIALSDRRIVRSQRLVAAAAALDGRRVASEADLWPLVYVVPDQESQGAAQEALRDLLGASDNSTAPRAAEEASASPTARAARLYATAKAAWTDRPSEEDAVAVTAWRLRLEALAREIDASLDQDQLTEDLANMRQEIAACLAAGDNTGVDTGENTGANEA